MLPRRPGTRGFRGAVASGVIFLAAGCGAESVAIPEVDLSAELETDCRSLVDGLPSALGDHERGEVVPPDALGATWGDPPIVLTCGADVPDGFDSTAFCQEVDGVGWYVPDAALEDESLDVTMVTVGHRPIVTVVVPAELRPEGVATVPAELADAVTEHTRLVRPCI